MKSNLIGIVILAAGASARLGTAKQLLEFQNRTLLRRSAETALEFSAEVVVTLGARSEILRTEIADLPVAIAENTDWETGMGGSLKIGLQKLLEKKADLCGVIAMVCDQPFVSAQLLGKLAGQYEAASCLIAACEYARTLGVPALFSARLFPELLALAPEHGAKQLIEKHLEKVVAVPFPEGAFDIDTPADYQSLIENFA